MDIYKEDDKYHKLLTIFSTNGLAPVGFSLQNGLLLYKDKVFLSIASPLKGLVLQYVHDSPLRGHFGYLKTLYRVKQDFFWWGMKIDVRDHIK